MKKINKFTIIVLFLMVAVLVLSLSNLESKMQEDKNNKVIKELDVTSKIIFLENKINELEVQNQILETEINNIKKLLPSPTPTIAPTNTPTPTCTPSPTPKEVKIKNINPTSIPKNNTSVKSNIYGEHRKVSTNITEKSGLNANEIDNLLIHILTEKYNKKTSRLLNNGNAFSKMEKDYNVNVLYALSVATFETNWGTEGVAKQNNLFAFINNNGNGYRHFDSVEESIMSFGNSARNYYFNKGVTSVKGISKIYCPPNHEEWTRQVTWLIDFFADNANKFIQK